MRKELEYKLQNEFPFMRIENPFSHTNFNDSFDQMCTVGKMKIHQLYKSCYSTYEQYGCQCGDGWYELIRGLCLEITEAYKEREEDIDLIPLQVKEKFGTLRFYYTLSSTGETPLTIDFLGSGQLIIHTKPSEISKIVRGIVSKWKKASGHTCEYCGAEGELRNLPWIRTLCDACYERVLLAKEKKEPIDNRPITWQWNLDDDGILTISGTGDMENAALSFHRGICDNVFGDNNAFIKSIVIGEGIRIYRTNAATKFGGGTLADNPLRIWSIAVGRSCSSNPNLF